MKSEVLSQVKRGPVQDMVRVRLVAVWMVEGEDGELTRP